MGLKGKLISLFITGFFMALTWELADMGFVLTFWWKVALCIVFCILANLLGKILGG